ncbi:MAG: alpha-mannosidase [Anaerolineae bacterium]
MDRFTLEKLEQRTEEIGQAVYAQVLLVAPLRWAEEWPAGATEAAYDDLAWPAITPPHVWGGRDVRGFLRCRFTVPPEWAGEAVALHVEISRGLHVSGPDATAYIDGVAYQGVDINHSEVLLPVALGSGEHVLALEIYSGTQERTHVFGGVSLVAIDRTARALYYDALTALQSARLLDEASLDRAQIINAVDRAMLAVSFQEPLGAEFRASLPEACRILATDLYEREWPGERPKIIGVGHAHIDVAWLWTLLHTRKKTGRTFLTTMRLMEQYPEHRFTQSQPQLYAYFRQDYPEHYDELKARVAEGRWEAEGGMWLEADSNVSGGEALVRQVLYGKRFLREQFGVESEVLWLPDAFGYSWALPQIMAGSGLKYFMTTKISWNEFNRMPHDTFRWQGVDGTQVLTHFVTTPSETWFATYNGKLTPAEVKGTWDQYKQKRANTELLLAYGFGDGGGGPTAQMLETARRLKNMPGMPRFEAGSAADFFHRLEEKSATFPVWNDELYLEFHRGTYTSQARNKRFNRKSEICYHDAEALAGIAALFGGRYRQDELLHGWRLILLNQFHDILPGSSIGEVYAESAEQYREVLDIGTAAADAATAEIARQVGLSEESALVFNTLGQCRSDLVEMAAPSGRAVRSVHGADGAPAPVQAVRGEAGDERLLFLAGDVPAYGWSAFALSDTAAEPTGAPIAEAGRLENRFFRINVDAAGRLTSVLDKSCGRQALAAGAVGNEFILFEDKPLNSDAWNIDIFYQEKQWPLAEAAEVSVIEAGPVRAGIEVRRSFRHSRLRQRIYIYADLPRIDFDTWVDWHEKHTLLKVAFPLAVHSRRATYEIQFGSIERATHWNTSWDWARFEVAAQRWADLSEGDYGVSILNDCKYGYDTHANTMRLTLLKSATSPDPEADQGEHRFTYSLYPHAGDWRNGTVAQAASLNVPLSALRVSAQSGPLPATWSLVAADATNLVVDTVKKAEDDDSLVVRVYEAFGQRGRGTLRFGRQLAAASECNLMEEDEREVAWQGSELQFDYLPYQIRSFKVRLA